MDQSVEDTTTSGGLRRAMEFTRQIGGGGRLSEGDLAKLREQIMQIDSELARKQENATLFGYELPGTSFLERIRGRGRRGLRAEVEQLRRREREAAAFMRRDRQIERAVEQLGDARTEAQVMRQFDDIATKFGAMLSKEVKDGIVAGANAALTEIRQKQRSQVEGFDINSQGLPLDYAQRYARNRQARGPRYGP